MIFYYYDKPTNLVFFEYMKQDKGVLIMKKEVFGSF